MRERSHARFDGGCRAEGVVVSRRVAMGSSGLAVLGVLSGAAFGQERSREEIPPGLPQEMRERVEQMRAFSERMRNAATDEERRKIMAEHQAAERGWAMERLKRELGVGDQEWAVIKPRLEAAYNLLHPERQSGPPDQRTMSPMDQKKMELRRMLMDQGATPDQIKTALTAFRAAREKADQELAKARQALRQIMTVRQEAVLVVNDILD